MKQFDDGIALIKKVVHSDGIVEENGHEPYITEWRGLWRGNCALIIRPDSLSEVSKVVKICSDHEIPVVPQGGNTGLVGGAVPDGGIVLSTTKLNKIRSIDPINMTLTCESGCILSDIQKASEEADRLFPLSLGAEGSCQIGGNLSTNAGGVQVLRYGNARDLVLGIEAVLPDGEIWNGLRGLRKDNTGYDLKHLFMGAEGTLGIITAAVLKLFPRPRQRETAIVALSNIEKTIDLFSRMTSSVGDSLTGFELMNSFSFSLPIKNFDNIRAPFKNKHDWYTLIELTSTQKGDNLRHEMENTLFAAMNDGVVDDAVLAESEEQAASFWQIRELIPEAQNPEGASIKNDITVPVSRVSEFLHRADEVMKKVVPGIRPVSFGHIGDGNIHYNLTQPENMNKKVFLDHWHDVTNAVNDIVFDLDGSFSAEHGIGQLKREELCRYRPSVEVQLMKAIKKTIDPKNIMNPNKLFSS